MLLGFALLVLQSGVWESIPAMAFDPSGVVTIPVIPIE
jgi:hypothetical protein